MPNNNRINVILSILLIIMIVIIGILGVAYYKCDTNIVETVIYQSEDPVVITDTDIIIDTLVIDNTEIKVKTDTIYKDDTIYITDSLIVPIHQVQFTDTFPDVNYLAYVSGFKPNLDSIKFNITNSINNKQQRRLNKGFNVGVGLGYDIVGMKPYVGVGISYGLNFNKK